MSSTKPNVILAVMTLSYFIAAAIGKMINFQGTVSGFIQVIAPLLKPFLSKPPSITLFQAVIYGVIVFQLLSSSIVLYTTYNPNAFLITLSTYALYSLIVFTVIATGLYHLKPTSSQISKTLSNMTVVAALWMLNERLYY